MKLQAYLLNNIPLSDYGSWPSSEVNGEPFLVGNTIYNGYQDVSSVLNWDKYGNRIKDYNYIRERIKEISFSIGFNNLSADEKIIASKYFVVSKSDRDTVLSEIEQRSYWELLIKFSQESRFNRWEHAKSYISYKLDPVNSSDLARSTAVLCNDYIQYNIITKQKDSVSGLFDYLKGEGDYQGSGYPSKNYWSQNDQDSLMDILENGNYNI